MDTSSNAAIWLGEATGNRRFVIALLAGLAIEIAAICGVLTFTHEQPPPTDHPTVVKLSLIAPAPPAPPAPKPPPPKPVVPPPPQPVAPPVPIPPPPPRPAVHHVFHRPPPPKPIVPPIVQPIVPPVVQPVEQTPPAPAAPSAGELDLFRAAMRAAVRRAAITPDAAAMAHEAGITRVSFTFLDGVPSDISIAASSGYPLLDDAAMQAVRDARYPAVPADMRGLAESVQVDVIFHLSDTSVDSD
jgi:protein TonB